jgi:hypothetical protein
LSASDVSRESGRSSDSESEVGSLRSRDESSSGIASVFWGESESDIVLFFWSGSASVFFSWRESASVSSLL